MLFVGGAETRGDEVDNNCYLEDETTLEHKNKSWLLGSARVCLCGSAVSTRLKGAAGATGTFDQVTNGQQNSDQTTGAENVKPKTRLKKK